MTRGSAMISPPALVSALILVLVQVAEAQDGLQPRAIPSPAREFRAAWVATVANIDWPSEPGLSVERQQSEVRAILDRLVELNMNAVVFQVRPQADALYASDLEPWSFYLTGKQGQPPDPFYDPLDYWVSEAHARGLELHAWFNPYRANHPANRGGLSEQSIVKSRPEMVVKLGSRGYYWMDPTRKDVQDHSIAVVLDVVNRYDVDGVHFDDYFYPYPSYHDNQDFPDDESWASYQASGGTLARGDWRRQAVNTFIRRLYGEIKKAKPHVEFGISPFGIWRPGHPASIRGLDQYAVLYADAKRWLNEGWVDYLTPQLYWPIAQIPQSFPVLLGWWNRENTRGRHLWPGTSLGRLRREGGVAEILNQVMIVRGMNPTGPGICMFSMRSLLRREGQLAAQLKDGPFAEPALIPASPWLDNEPPAAPVVHMAKRAEHVQVSWTAGSVEPVSLWVLYSQSASGWSYRILPGRVEKIELAIGDGVLSRVAISAIDRSRNESEKTVIEVN